MRKHLPLALVLVVLAASFPVSAQGIRVTVSGVSGERKPRVSRQLEAALCGPYECVSRHKVYRKGRPDFDLLVREDVSAVIYGAVSGKGARRKVRVALLRDSLEPERSWTFALDRTGAIPARSLDGLVRDLRVELGGAPARPPPAAASSPVVRTAPPSPPPQALPAAPAPPRAVEASPPPPPPATPVSAALPPRTQPVVAPSPQAFAPAPRTPSTSVARPTAAPRPLLCANELGAWVTSRELSYSGAVPGGTSALLGFEAAAIASPRARLELYPLALASRGLLAGIGLFGEYSQSIGLTTSAAGAPGTTYDSRLRRLQAGMAWRLHPLSSSRLAVVPSVSYQRLEFAAETSSPGLPDSELSGVKAGLGLEVPLGGRFGLLLEGGYVMWTTVNDLVGGDPAYFPSGSASALEAEAGFSVALFGAIALRVVGEYSSTTYRLDPDPSGSYVATGATDRYLGGRAMVRAEF